MNRTTPWPWVAERPQDPENCVREHPRFIGRIMTAIKDHWQMRMVTRKSVKEYGDFNRGDIVNLLAKDPMRLAKTINNDRHLIARNTVFGGSEWFCKAKQFDRSFCLCINDHGHKRLAK